MPSWEPYVQRLYTSRLNIFPTCTYRTLLVQDNPITSRVSVPWPSASSLPPLPRRSPTPWARFQIQVNSSETTPTPSSTGLYIQVHCPPSLIPPGPGTRQLVAAPTPQSLQKLFKPSKPKPAYPASPVLPAEIRALAHVSVPSLCLTMHLGTSLCPPAWRGRACPLLLRLWRTNRLFIGSRLLICWPHHDPNFLLIHFILKHLCLIFSQQTF